MIFQIRPSNPPKKNQNYSPLEIHSPIQVNNQKLNICCFHSKYNFCVTFYPNTPKYTIKSYLLYQLKVLYELFFIKKIKFHNFVTRVIKMINFITIINIDTTWPLPTNTNVHKHTQNSYGMCYLHTTNIFLIYSNTLLVILFIYLIPFLPF